MSESTGDSPADYVVSAAERDRTILLDLVHGRYYGLNDVGTRIWDLLCEGADRNTIVLQVAEQYAISHDTVAHDVEAFVTALAERQLVKPR